VTQPSITLITFSSYSALALWLRPSPSVVTPPLFRRLHPPPPLSDKINAVPLVTYSPFLLLHPGCFFDYTFPFTVIFSHCLLFLSTKCRPKLQYFLSSLLVIDLIITREFSWIQCLILVHYCIVTEHVQIHSLHTVTIL
jgi:hypothetical protein